MSEKQKRPQGLSSGRNSSMIKGYVKGARKVNPKCEPESHFGVGGFQLDSVNPKSAWVDS
jgi:basic membrane lipoprotein Med (substrate-binding protein (PBP1-ABC) superfamily)